MMEAQTGSGTVLPIALKDPKYQAPGWKKIQYTHELPKRKINVHYMKNELTGEMDQFKFNY